MAIDIVTGTFFTSIGELGLSGATNVSFDIYIGLVGTIINAEHSTVYNNGENPIYIVAFYMKKNRSIGR